jgi:hypothetical protein
MIDVRWEAELVPQLEKPDGDPEETWRLDTSIAVVLPPPASIYNPQRPNHFERWEALVAAFEQELAAAAEQTVGLTAVEAERHPYRTIDTGGHGGPYGDVTELMTLAKDAHQVVQGLAGWLALADFGIKLAELWKQVRFQKHEYDDEGEWPKLPLLSLPFIRALCIKDMAERYGIDDVPAVAVDTRPVGKGGQRHPTGAEHHICTVLTGTVLEQRLVWVVSSQGICWEKFVLLDGPPPEVHALRVPEWVSPHTVLAV